MSNDNRCVKDENEKHSSVGKTFEIDQRAIKEFLSWLPDGWLPRKQDPDFFVDYVVEIVENGEPTGKHFAAQIKGYDDIVTCQKPLAYAFKTKHLKYYLNRNQHPVFLFLINVASREGYWFFAQKFLKENIPTRILNDQQTLTISFSAEDSLLNITKFKCLLPEAEKFVRNLHPGSISAAWRKRKEELELMDPRCSVSIAINKNGKEQISITPKEAFSFKTRIRSKNVEGWKKFFESGAEVKVEPGEMEIIGAPLLAEVFKTEGGISRIQFGNRHPATIQIFCGAGENLTVFQINGQVSAGSKFVTFNGTLPESPIEITGELPLEIKFQDEASTHITISLDKWTGQGILLLSHFDQIETLVRTSAEAHTPKMEILVHGNVLYSGRLENLEAEQIKGILYPIQWLKKCRWIAQHFNINPILPKITDVSDEQWDTIEDLYGLLKNKEIVIPEPGQRISFITSGAPLNKDFAGDGTLVIEKEEQMIDFFGGSVRLGPTRHTFSDVKLISRSPSDEGETKFVFETSDATKRTSILC